MIEIDEEKCTKCNLCYKVCIGGPIYEGPEIKSDPDILCIECGHCYAICPENAITLKGFEDFKPYELTEKPPVDGPSLMSLLRGRRSGRIYKPEPVSKEHLLEIIEAASLAPSAHMGYKTKAYVYQDEELLLKISRKTIRFYKRLVRIFNAFWFPLYWWLIGQDSDEIETHIHAFESLWTSPKNDDILFYHTKTLLVFTAPNHNDMALGDAWIMAQNAVNYAESIKVATVYNGFLIQAAYYDPRVKRALKIPRREKVVAALNLGYPKHDFAREAPRPIMDITWM